MNKTSIIRNKSRDFAIRIIRLYQYLCKEKKEYIISKQLLRAGTSIGANVNEALCGISKKDFLAKIYISYKEAAECNYWLDLLYETGYLNSNEYKSINKDCKELLSILSSITKTIRQQINT
ncbi:MAG: four helix bundle protein [Marinifilaceae bacterium]|nr:four helix bundle protein [Marinifilaceae bacterium]